MERRQWAPRGRPRLRLRDGDHEADGGEHVADAHALHLRADLHHRLAGVVPLPGDLPPLLLRAADRLHELADDLLEGVAVAVVKDGEPGGGKGLFGGVPLAHLRRLERPARRRRHAIASPSLRTADPAEAAVTGPRARAR